MLTIDKTEATLWGWPPLIIIRYMAYHPRKTTKKLNYEKNNYRNFNFIIKLYPKESGLGLMHKLFRVN